MTTPLRNIAIIAHVDHGKTTLIDVLLRQSGTFRENEQVAERIMDSNDLERERGITIMAKVTSLLWKDARINIVDTPGHADFGGEVERILNMVDGAVVLVDAAEGPMPQTKFVVSKALKVGLKPIVVVNKIDKQDQRAEEVIDETFDLFANLDANEEQLDFPVLYGSAKQGWMADDASGLQEDMSPLLDKIIEHFPEPSTEEGEFRMLATTIYADPYLGRILTGRISSGEVTPGMPIKALDKSGKLVEQGRVSKVLGFKGIEKTPIDKGQAGDIVCIAGLTKATVAHTLCALSVDKAIDAQPIDPPTLAMMFRINDGPLVGRDGDKVQSRVILDRLKKEAEGNIALEIRETEDKESFEVAGRGELQLGVLIENMRREGFELTVGRPHVVYKKDENGQRLEPVEECIIDVDDEFSGAVVEGLSQRKGEMQEMRPSGTGRTRLVFLVPTRGLIGYQPILLSDTRGTATINRLFHSYEPFKGDIPARHTGVLISTDNGDAVAYALANLEDRGSMLIKPGTAVYQGMIVGEHTRGNDLEVNVLKGKKLTNVRASGKDDGIFLSPPKLLTLEQAMSYINDDELVEVTPKHIRLRKRYLDPHERKRNAKTA